MLGAVSAEEWYVGHRGILIGLVRVEVGRDHEEEYMCRETGIGTGTLHKVSNLVPAGEGDVEVVRRNAEGKT